MARCWFCLWCCLQDELDLSTCTGLVGQNKQRGERLNTSMFVKTKLCKALLSHPNLICSTWSKFGKSSDGTKEYIDMLFVHITFKMERLKIVDPHKSPPSRSHIFTLWQDEDVGSANNKDPHTIPPFCPPKSCPPSVLKGALVASGGEGKAMPGNEGSNRTSTKTHGNSLRLLF